MKTTTCLTITFKHLHLHEKSEGKAFGFIYSTSTYRAPMTQQTLHRPSPMGMQQRTNETQPQPSRSLSSGGKIHMIGK